jgi:hypothetical protein
VALLNVAIEHGIVYKQWETGIRAEDLKQWVNMHESEEGDSTPFETLRTLVEDAFVTGDLPQKLHVAILVLLPKRNSS